MILHTNKGKVNIATNTAAAQRDKRKFVFDIVWILKVIKVVVKCC